MKRHLQKNGSKIAILASLLGVIGLGLIFFNQSKDNQTNAQFFQATGCNMLTGWTNGWIPNGQSVFGFKEASATYTQTCNELKGTLLCTSGSFGLNGNIYKNEKCVDKNRKNCTSPIAAKHLEYKVLYNADKGTPTKTCSSINTYKNFQCIDGQFTGTDVANYIYSGCVDSTQGQCKNDLTNSYVDNLDFVMVYKSAQSNNTQTCNNLLTKLTCLNQQRSGGLDPKNYNLSCKDLNILDCTFTGGQSSSITIPHNTSSGFYSDILRSVPGKKYTTCDILSGSVSCNNGSLIGADTNTFKYTRAQCDAGTPKSCSITGQSLPINNGQSIRLYSKILGSIAGIDDTKFDCEQYSGEISCNNGVLVGADTNVFKYTKGQCLGSGGQSCKRNGGTILNGETDTGYSLTGVKYPDTCANHSTILRCVNGVMDGDATTYKEPYCNILNAPQYLTDFIISVTGRSDIAQYSNPTLNISIKNRGTALLTGTLKTGFISCYWDGPSPIKIYESRPVSGFVLNPDAPINISAVLSDKFTQALGQKSIKCTINTPKEDRFKSETVLENNTRTGTLTVIQAGRFDIAINRAVLPIKKNLEAPEVTIGAGPAGGAETIKNFISKKVMDVLVPLIILIGILTAILGFYKLFFSTDEKSTGEGIKYITYGVIGIIIIMSASWMQNTIVTLFSAEDIKGSQIASTIYTDMVYPFLKLFIYLVLGVMFIILASRVVTFIFGTDEEAKKKAGTIIGRNIISMLVIIGSKQIVETIYGKIYSNNAVVDVSNLGDIGTGILANKNIPIIYSIINRALGLASFIVLVVIIMQTVSLLMNPDSPEQIKKIKNSLVYIFIGILVIGTGYLITNFLIIN